MDWYIECGGVYNINDEKVFGRKIFVSLLDIDKIINRFDNKDVYYTNFMYNEKDQNKSDIIGPLYLDLDFDITDDESYQKVKHDTLRVVNFLKIQLRVPSSQIRIFFSGNKGFHIIVSHHVFGLTPCKNLNDLYKIIALKANSNTVYKMVDTRIYDKKRLFRLPHSINCKTGLYKVPITEEVLRKSDYDFIREYASCDQSMAFESGQLNIDAKNAFEKLTKRIARPRPKTSSVINKDYEIPLCIKRVFALGAQDGQRNNTLIIIASSLFQKGFNLEDCIESLRAWNIERNDNPIADKELETTIKSAYRQIQDGRRYGCTSIREMGLCVKECTIRSGNNGK